MTLIFREIHFMDIFREINFTKKLCLNFFLEKLILVFEANSSAWLNCTFSTCLAYAHKHYTTITMCVWSILQKQKSSLIIACNNKKRRGSISFQNTNENSISRQDQI